MAIRVALPTCDPVLEYATCSGVEATEMYRRGKLDYIRKHPDVLNAIEAGLHKSGCEHFLPFGSQEGRVYQCCHPPCKFIETHVCPLGEAAYNAEY
jgi:hypothetical protein